MALGGIYKFGTVDLVAGETSVVGHGVMWSDVIEGDWLVAQGLVCIIDTVTGDDLDGLTLEAGWPGSGGNGLSYQIIKMSWLRYDPSLVQAEVRKLLAALQAQGTFLFVLGDAPDAEAGEDGDWALKVNDGGFKLWSKADGVWTQQTSINDLADLASAATDAEAAATTATTQAGIATAQAGAASDSATAAALSESNAAASETAAASSETNAEDSLTEFELIYFGRLSADPSTAPVDGSALVAGQFYWNTTNSKLRLWGGSSWTDAAFSASGALVAANNLSDLADPPTALTNLGGTTVGKAVFRAANEAAAQTAIGATTTGKALLTATNAADARDTIGATTVGDALIIAVDEDAAQTAIGASTFIKTLFDDADAATARATLAIACELISTTSITSGASAESITGLDDNDYLAFQIRLRNVVVGSASALSMRLIFSGSPNTSSNYRYHFDVSGSDSSSYVGSASASAAQFFLSGTMGAGGVGYNGTIDVPNRQASAVNMLSWLGVFYAGSSLVRRSVGGGYLDVAGALQGLQFYPSTGTFSGGAIDLYGLRG